MLALLEGGPGLMLAVVIAYCVINVVIQSVIQPKMIGDAVGLSASVTFLSLVIWSWILGPLGAVLAVPLSLFVRAVLVDVDPGSRWGPARAPVGAGARARTQRLSRRVRCRPGRRRTGSAPGR